MHSPFDVQTPENLSTDDMLSLFVSENTDYWQIEKAGHTFLRGPRGAGKSMFFRYLESDCQCKVKGVPLSQLDYYAAYIPVKETELKITELIRLEEARHATVVLNEHLMITHISSKIFTSLSERTSLNDEDGKYGLEFAEYFSNCLTPLLLRCGWKGNIATIITDQSIYDQFRVIIDLFDDIFAELNSYIRKLSFEPKIIPYDGALFGYADFLVPLVKGLQKLSFMPNGPFFLLIDDADNLSFSQAMILNSWVARRTTGFLSLKVSAQEGEYETYVSSSGQRIESPHDYSEFNIADKYTSDSDNYKKRLRDIIQRRLDFFELKVSPEEFFPENEAREKSIKEIGEEIRKNWETEGRGHRPGDDVLRYARPNYILRLSGPSQAGHGSRKSGSTYSYSGFSQLVHLSSGIIRHFLEASSLMYAEAVSRAGDKPVKQISHSIQNQITKQYSDDFLFLKFDEVVKAEGDENEDLDRPTKLRNLIFALGGMFKTILMDETLSERRVFSIAFSNGPKQDVQEILNLGVKYGYFHRSTIGNKEGTGRVPLYILTRRLAPTFGLDPTGFAGYKFVQNDAIVEVMHNPKKMIGRVQKKGFEDALDNDDQGSLFENV